MMSTRWYRAMRDERGSELVEFSLAILVLLALFFGIMDFSRAMYSYHYVTYAAQEGARYAIVRGGDWATQCATSAPPNFQENYACIAQSADVQNFVRSAVTPLVNASDMTVTTTWPGTTPDCAGSCNCSPADSQGCMVKVQVSYTFHFMLPFLPQSAGLHFSGTSEKVIQQ